MIPNSALRDAISEALQNLRAGVGDYAKARGEAVRLGKATLTFEVTFDGDEVVQSRQETDETAGARLTTTTEKPVVGEGEITTTVKSGNYVQSGTQETAQGGGSQDVATYEYDEA